MDWDKDGKLDILTGCYWTSKAEAAHLQFLKGLGGNNFAKPVALKSDSGEPLLNVPHKDVPEGERKYDLKNICIHQFAADIDDDGDLDILVGSLSKKAYVHKNNGSAERSSFSEYGNLLLDLPSVKSSPYLYDWDNDGDLDFLTGSGEGDIYLALNEGDSKAPDWKTFTKIINKSDTQGSMSKLCVTDWNNDSLPDILVGTRKGNVKVFLQQ